MKKNILLFLLFCFCPILGWAQQYIVSGKIIDEQTKEPVEIATAALLRADSTLVVGAMSDEQGAFRLNARAAGSYILKLSYIGYAVHYSTVVLTPAKPVYELGSISLKHNENLLGTATVTATAAKVEQVEDTTMYNARPGK